jgi:hypothetical protein
VTWALVLAIGLAFVVLCVYLVRLGMQSTANQILTVLGSLSGILGVGLSVFSLIAGRHQATNDGKKIQVMKDSPGGTQIMGSKNVTHGRNPE